MSLLIPLPNTDGSGSATVTATLEKAPSGQLYQKSQTLELESNSCAVCGGRAAAPEGGHPGSRRQIVYVEGRPAIRMQFSTNPEADVSEIVIAHNLNYCPLASCPAYGWTVRRWYSEARANPPARLRPPPAASAEAASAEAASAEAPRRSPPKAEAASAHPRSRGARPFRAPRSRSASPAAR